MTGPSGNFPEYRSVVNLGQGLILNGLDFTIIDPKKRLFDRVDASASGWGGDPYNSGAAERPQAGRVRRSLFDYRNIAFFDAVPAYANPLAPGGFNEQSFDTHRRYHEHRAGPAAGQDASFPTWCSTAIRDTETA